MYRSDPMAMRLKQLQHSLGHAYVTRVVIASLSMTCSALLHAFILITDGGIL